MSAKELKKKFKKGVRKQRRELKAKEALMPSVTQRVADTRKTVMGGGGEKMDFIELPQNESGREGRSRDDLPRSLLADEVASELAPAIKVPTA